MIPAAFFRRFEVNLNDGLILTSSKRPIMLPGKKRKRRGKEALLTIKKVNVA